MCKPDSSAPLYIRYHSIVTNEGLFPPLFVQAFSTKLAHDSCERITQSTTKKDSLLRLFDLTLNQAYLADAIDGSSDTMEESNWLSSRE